LAVNLIDPLFFDRSSGFAAFAADDGPMDVAKIDDANGSNQRLEGDEPNSCGSQAEMVDTVHDLSVFNTGAEPDIGPHIAYLGGDERGHAFWPLCQDLVVVARGLAHDLPDTEDEFVADALVEKVAHGVYKRSFAAFSIHKG
jgi:hypothetical protein